MPGARISCRGPSSEIHGDSLGSTGRYSRALQDVSQHWCLYKRHHARTGLDNVRRIQRGCQDRLRDQGSGARQATQGTPLSELSENRFR